MDGIINSKKGEIMPKNSTNKPLYPPKDHQKWAKLKSQIHNNITKRELYHEGEIYWFYFGNNVGVEEDGKNELYSRPAIIVRGFSDALIWVIPLSRTKRSGRYYHTFKYRGRHGEQDSKALLSQMRPFDTGRISGHSIGRVTRDTLDDIRAQIIKLVAPAKDRP